MTASFQRLVLGGVRLATPLRRQRCRTSSRPIIGEAFERGQDGRRACIDYVDVLARVEWWRR
jgi:hypothetical protein